MAEERCPDRKQFWEVLDRNQSEGTLSFSWPEHLRDLSELAGSRTSNNPFSRYTMNFPLVSLVLPLFSPLSQGFAFSGTLHTGGHICPSLSCLWTLPRSHISWPLIWVKIFSLRNFLKPHFIWMCLKSDISFIPFCWHESRHGISILILPLPLLICIYKEDNIQHIANSSFSFQCNQFSKSFCLVCLFVCFLKQSTWK